jgi:GNAT superfamily N-acetyltransferase
VTSPIDWREEPIGRRHDRRGFDCGNRDLNEYLIRFARQNHDLGGGKTFVAVQAKGSPEVLGYYTIGPGSVAYAKVPPSVRKGLGRYDVPVFRLARLAIRLDKQGRGLGADLLLAAGARALAVATEAGGVALAIDAKDDRASVWYARFGAVPLMDDPLKLILPLRTIAAALTAASRRTR